MTCQCIGKFNDKLAPDQELDASIVFSRTDHRMSLQTYSGLVRKDTGKPENRRSRPRLAAHTFCPFCGTRYDSQPCATNYHGQPNPGATIPAIGEER